ncbi:hypothetical protein MNBD_IGNAVI01-1650 [hydrothermal vent metagenome]|uniref:Secretion system C-terminal sorting domain-containing protein n=1 Tax=hydrothermal vent metagenome TaxID=652676 RepID=A0A3B1CKU9_9ZZZZ
MKAKDPLSFLSSLSLINKYIIILFLILLNTSFAQKKLPYSPIINSTQVDSFTNLGEYVSDLFIDPEIDGRLVASKWDSDYGIKISTDNGENWTHAVINVSPHSSQYLNCNALSFNTSNFDVGYIAAGIDLYKTIDRGESWDSTGFSDFFPEYELRNYHDIYFVKLHPTRQKIIFVSNFQIVTHEPNLFQSKDDGESWIISDSSTKYEELVFDNSNPNVIYGIEQHSFIKKTIDEGDTWKSINNNLVFSFYNISSLEISKSNPNVLYCGQLFDTDHETWRLSMTTNGGENWVRIDSTLLDIDPEGSVYAILLDNNVEGRFYISYTGGLYLTEDNGEHFQKIYSGNTGSIWADNKNPATIYFNSDQGLLRFGDTVTVDVEEDINELPNNFRLEQNYPNPFNPSTTIKYSIPRNTEYYSVQHVTLRVFDILGGEITTLVNKEQKPGSYEVKFDASDLGSGIFFYQLRAGGYTQSRKMILLK